MIYGLGNFNLLQRVLRVLKGPLPIMEWRPLQKLWWGEWSLPAAGLYFQVLSRLSGELSVKYLGVVGKRSRGQWVSGLSPWGDWGVLCGNQLLVLSTTPKPERAGFHVRCSLSSLWLRSELGRLT